MLYLEIPQIEREIEKIENYARENGREFLKEEVCQKKHSRNNFSNYLDSNGKIRKKRT